MFSQCQMLKAILAAACLSLSTWAQSSPPAGALIVRQGNTGRGEHATISSAVAALAGLTGPKTIFVYPGSYAEQVKISYSYPLKLRGFSNNPTSAASNRVTVRAAISAAQTGSNAKSATIWAHSADIRISNLIIDVLYALEMSSTRSEQGQIPKRLLWHLPGRGKLLAFAASAAFRTLSRSMEALILLDLELKVQ
ncbi:hypothetical protein Pst134EB_008134 [Puccinia striiformis f. sp. tritici]|nr:hypothetical protein Pst134EB_008134 [Puccinia striiformis f. sp. tritici]